jgi:hypothetical protein
MGRGVQLQLVGDIVNDAEQVALIEVCIERVSALGERLRLTTTVISSLALSFPSEAVRRST